MAAIEQFDPTAFKTMQRGDWKAAAAGWRRWHDMLEAGGAIVTQTLVGSAALGPGDIVLDVGTGYGEPALTAARLVQPTGRVVASDLAAAMLEFGRERAAQAHLDNVEFLEADAEELTFDDGTFDAILSRQGLQFLPDVAGTLKRFHGFLKRDGRLAAAVWGPPDTVQFARAHSVIVEALDLPAPPPGRPGIFALSDSQRLAALVSDAGFRDIETGVVTVVYELPSPEDFTTWIQDVAPPIANLPKGQPPEVQEEIWRKVTDAWGPFTSADGSVRTTNQAIWIAATKFR